MEKLKPLDEFEKPDKRNEGFMKRTNDGLSTFTYRDFYKEIEKITLTAPVPNEIRSYFAMVKNIYIHGWYYYPLFTIAGFFSLSAIEMGLRERFKKEDPNQKKPFKCLLKMAVDNSLIEAGKFSHIKEPCERSKFFEKETGGLIKAFPKTEEYCRVLVDTIPSLRNAFFHPSMTTLIMPGQALSMIRISCELIDQLFAGEMGSG